MVAYAAATAQIHGTGDGREGNGGRNHSSTAAAAVATPRPTRTASHRRDDSPRRTRQAATRRPATDATTATVAHRGERPHAPKAVDPSPDVIQGSAVDAAATANATTTWTAFGRRADGVSSGGSSPRTRAMHSWPNAAPRTGIAQARHIARPQPSHVATDARPVWTEHRSAVRCAPRSSFATLGAYSLSGRRPSFDSVRG